MGAIGVSVAILLAMQQSGSPPPESAPPVSLERIQRELENPRPSLLPVIRSDLIFRVEVEAFPLKFPPLWDPASGTAVPNYVRPFMPLYHHEFLAAVTPEAFRGATLFPIGFNALQAGESLADAIRRAIRRAREERARREVQEELRKFLEEQEKRKRH